MEHRTYLFDMSKATIALHAAMRGAKALLPDHAVRQYWIAKETSPSPWASVEAWYLKQDFPIDAEVACALTDLKLMAEAMACLRTVATPQRDAAVAPNFTLAKVRRTA